jgi:hypothetical protein
VNKCDWMPNLALFSQFVTCLGRIVHHSPNACARKSLRSDFGVNSSVVLGSGRKTLRKDLRFPALTQGRGSYYAVFSTQSPVPSANTHQ